MQKRQVYKRGMKKSTLPKNVEQSQQIDESSNQKGKWMSSKLYLAWWEQRLPEKVTWHLAEYVATEE